MKISVHVKAGAREERVEKVSETEYRVSVKAPPIEGKANDDVIRILADYFRVSKLQIRIVVGHTAKNKILEIIS